MRLLTLTASTREDLRYWKSLGFLVSEAIAVRSALMMGMQVDACKTGKSDAH